MKNIIIMIKYSVLIVFLSTFNISIAHAQEDLELCPPGFDQGAVTTGFVECNRDSSSKSTIEEAQLNRLEREAICNTHPNSEVTSSGVFGTTNGRFFSMVTCTVTRAISAGTVLCPDDTEEVYRAFDTLVCQDFGSPSATAQAAQTALNAQIAECTSAPGGEVLDTQLNEEMFNNTTSGDETDDITFFTSSVACGFTTAAVDNIECPFSFSETDRDENTIECEVDEEDFETMAEADAASDAAKAICTDTTAGLGTVDAASLVSMTTTAILTFSSLVICNVKIPRYGDFSDQTILRACDASCTEDVEQARICLNGGVIGGPGCIASSTQMIERKCNTGPDRSGLCPLMVTPMANVVPLLLLDDEDED